MVLKKYNRKDPNYYFAINHKYTICNNSLGNNLIDPTIMV